MKILSLDTETTGLQPSVADVIQIGALIRIDSEIIDEINVKCQPVKWDTISKRALEVNNTTMEQLKSYMLPKEAWKLFNEFIVSNFDDQKYIFSGQNTSFDWKFIEPWWNDNKDKDAPGWSYFFKKHQLDLQILSTMFKNHGLINVPNIKLETIIEALNIEVEGNLHDALTDIKGTDAALIEYVHRVNKLKRDHPNHPVVERFERLLVLI